MADEQTEPVTLDDLSDPQREALQWLASQAENGNAAVEPPDEHRTQTWKALVKRGLAQRHDDGTVQITPTGAALFAHQASDDATNAAAAAEGASEAAHDASQAAQDASAAADQASTEASEAASTAQRSGEQAAATADAAAAPPPADDQPGQVKLSELRPQHRGRDAKGDWRVIGIPEALHGSREGHVRVLVTRNDTRRDYLRGPADDVVDLVEPEPVTEPTAEPTDE